MLFLFKDLMEIHITNRGHRKKILALILALPPDEIEQEVPVSIYNLIISVHPGDSCEYVCWDVFSDTW